MQYTPEHPGGEITLVWLVRELERISAAISSRSIEPWSILPNQTGNLEVRKEGTPGRVEVAGDVHATAFVTTSDIRHKIKIEPVVGALGKSLGLQVFTHEWRHEDEGSRYAGVSAQQVEKVLPEVVVDTSSGAKAVDYGKLAAVLGFGAIRELSELVSEQEARISYLEEKLSEISPEMS